MDPAALQDRLKALGERPAASDAERRAAVVCDGELWRSGRRPRTQPLWIRRQRSLPRAVYALAGVVASVVAVDHAAAGLAIVLGALVALFVESAGVPLVSLLQIRRATQNVIASAPADGRIRLILTAPLDGPRRSALARLFEQPWLARAPGPAGILALVLLANAACIAVRLGGAEGTAIGAIQLVPSILLLALAAGFIDDGLGRAGTGASGLAVVSSLTKALDASPPRSLAVEVVLAGAGEAGAAGMRAYVRWQRANIAPEEVVVIHLGNAGGPLRYLVSDGELLPYRLHPRLIELAAAIPGARPVRGHGHSAARVARGARWPAIALEGEPRPLAAAALRLIVSIDREFD